VECGGTTPLWAGRDVSRPGKRGHARALQKGQRMGGNVECGGTTPLWAGRDMSRPGKRRHVGALQKGRRMGESAVMPAHAKENPKETNRLTNG